MTYTLGTYITEYQGVVDFVKMKQTYPFTFIRVTDGDANDKMFKVNYPAAQSAGLIRGAVHEHKFHLASPPQLNRFLTWVMGEPPNIPPVFMITEANCFAINPKNIVARMSESLDILDNAFGYKVFLAFSGKTFSTWIRWIPDRLMKGRELFALQPGVESPIVWQQFKRWLFWNYSDSGSGQMAGATSKFVKMIKWNGDLNSLKRFCNLPIDEIVTPPVDPSLVERITNLEKRVTILENK